MVVVIVCVVVLGFLVFFLTNSYVEVTDYFYSLWLALESVNYTVNIMFYKENHFLVFSACKLRACDSTLSPSVLFSFSVSFFLYICVCVYIYVHTYISPNNLILYLGTIKKAHSLAIITATQVEIAVFGMHACLG